MPERFDYGYAASNIVATIVIVNGQVLQISRKVKYAKFLEVTSV